MYPMLSSDAQQPLGGYRLAPPLFFEPEWFEREQRDLFPQHWAFVGFEHDLADPGDYVVAEVGHHPMLVCRSLDGELHALHNVCRHRGIRLCAKAGNAKALSCPYHAWRYGLNGALEHIPQHREQFPTVALQDWGLLKGRVDTWAGMVFVHVDPSAADLADWLGGLATRLARFDANGLSELSVQHYEMAANWKFFVENHIDWLHLYFLHAKTLKAFDHDRGDIQQHGPHWTSFEVSKPSHAKETAERAEGLIELPGLLPQDRDIGAHLVFPNLALFTSPTSFTSVFVRPLGPEETRIELRVHGMSGSDPAKLESDVFADVMVEDRMAAQELQAAVRSSAYGVGPMAQTWEAPIAHFHDRYRRSMGLGGSM